PALLEAEKTDLARPQNPGLDRPGSAAHSLCGDAVLPYGTPGFDPDGLAPPHGGAGGATMDRSARDVALSAACGGGCRRCAFLQASRHRFRGVARGDQ